MPDSYQGLVGREHGGIGAVSVQGNQWHGAELLLGEVRGGAAAHDDGALVIVLHDRSTGSHRAVLLAPCPPEAPHTVSPRQAAPGEPRAVGPITAFPPALLPSARRAGHGYKAVPTPVLAMRALISVRMQPVGLWRRPPPSSCSGTTSLSPTEVFLKICSSLTKQL